MSLKFNGSGHAPARRTIVLKAPRRITITIPHSTFEYLVQRSDLQGRSLSNLAAYLLERSCQDSNNSPHQ
jgi:hypothetical protein